MPNDRRGRRATRRVKSAPRLRVAPVLLLGLVAAAVFGNSPSGEKPVRWTMRNADAWMADFDGVREVRAAAASAALREVAEAPPIMVGTVPITVKPIVVADADRPPRDVPKLVPDDAGEPEITGSVPASGRADPPKAPRVHPAPNRTGKTDRLFAPTPIGRTTEHDIFTRPTLAVVPPSLDGWPPVATIASLTAPLSEKAMPRLALAHTPAGEAPFVVAMVRSGPGRIVTQSAIAAIGHDGARPKSRALLPPVPETQTAAASPRTRVWAQPDVPAIGYARSNDVEYRFKSLLGDQETGMVPPADPDEQLPP